jgi:integrase
LLPANGEDVKVVQELLRHASARITMDVTMLRDTKNEAKLDGKVVCPLCVPGKNGISNKLFGL